MTYHKFPFMASYFQLVDNKNKNNFKLDVTQQATENIFFLYFISDMILEIMFKS